MSITPKRKSATRAGSPRPRITDVAAHAGVSIKTVSRVINGEQGVQPQTRSRVMESVQALGFVPNSAARSLKAGTQPAIGVLIDQIADPFFASLLGVIEELALAQGLSVVFASTGLDKDREREQLIRLAGERLRGMVVAPIGISATDLDALRGSCPVVCADRERHGFDSVILDDRGASRDAVSGLLERGHRRIAFLGYDERYPTLRDRYQGFCEALAPYDLSINSDWVIPHGSNRANWAVSATHLLQMADPPTAVFCSTSRAAMGIVDARRTMGDRGTAIVSFGDFEAADLLNPGISCIDQDPHLIAEAAFNRLLEIIDDPSSPPRRIIVPTTYIPRGSGELLPCTATDPGGHS